MKNTENENKIKEIIASTIKELNTVVDVNTIMGKPLNCGEDLIIPISKVTFSFITGGGEYGRITFKKNSGSYPMSAGSGTVVSLKPAGFLVKDKWGNYQILNVANNKIERLIDTTNEYIKKLTNENV